MSTCMPCYTACLFSYRPAVDKLLAGMHMSSVSSHSHQATHTGGHPDVGAQAQPLQKLSRCWGLLLTCLTARLEAGKPFLMSGNIQRCTNAAMPLSPWPAAAASLPASLPASKQCANACISLRSYSVLLAEYRQQQVFTASRCPAYIVVQVRVIDLLKLHADRWQSPLPLAAYTTMSTFDDQALMWCHGVSQQFCHVCLCTCASLLRLSVTSSLSLNTQQIAESRPRQMLSAPSMSLD